MKMHSYFRPLDYRVVLLNCLKMAGLLLICFGGSYIAWDVTPEDWKVVVGGATGVLAANYIHLVY